MCVCGACVLRNARVSTVVCALSRTPKKCMTSAVRPTHSDVSTVSHHHITTHLIQNATPTARHLELEMLDRTAARHTIHSIFYWYQVSGVRYVHDCCCDGCVTFPHQYFLIIDTTAAIMDAEGFCCFRIAQTAVRQHQQKQQSNTI